MTRQWVFVVVVSAVVVMMAAGCQSTGAPPERSADDLAVAALQPDGGNRAQPAGDGEWDTRCVLMSFDTGNAVGRLTLIEAAVDAIRGGKCAAVSPELRMCRSLFLTAATDPIAGIGAGLDAWQLRHLAALHAWAVADGTEAAADLADDELEAAFRRLASLDLVAALSVGDDAVAAIAIARADSTILDPLVRAENDCA